MQHFLVAFLNCLSSLLLLAFCLPSRTERTNTRAISRLIAESGLLSASSPIISAIVVVASTKAKNDSCDTSQMNINAGSRKEKHVSQVAFQTIPASS
jgi:hypothetical protein